MKSKYVLIILTVILILCSVTACSLVQRESGENTLESAPETIMNTAESVSETQTTNVTEKTSETTENKKKETTGSSTATTTEKKENTTTAKTTTKSATKQSTTQTKQTTTKKETTTKKVTTTKKITTTEEVWDCNVDGHTSETGQIGWVNSFDEAQEKALGYIDENADSGNFRVEQCHICGKYTAYVTLH
ncbi:MAG: hypothetical protein ACI4HO_02745 [Ruminococcus sp.]